MWILLLLGAGVAGLYWWQTHGAAAGTAALTAAVDRVLRTETDPDRLERFADDLQAHGYGTTAETVRAHAVAIRASGTIARSELPAARPREPGEGAPRLSPDRYEPEAPPPARRGPAPSRRAPQPTTSTEVNPERRAEISRLVPLVVATLRRGRSRYDHSLVRQFQGAAAVTPQTGLYGGRTRAALIHWGAAAARLPRPFVEPGGTYSPSPALAAPISPITVAGSQARSDEAELV